MSSSLDFSEVSPVDGYYDVFLSFRGDDTRKGFTTNLYHALQDNQIHTFMDEHNLIGEEIVHLFQVIAKSKMAVIIYSENFASSDWCLRELETILQHREDKKILVTPIFYKVDLTELKHITGKTATYLDQHVAGHGKSTADLWKVSVKKLGGLSGISYKEIEYRSEYEFMKHVIGIIKKRLLKVCEDHSINKSSQVMKHWPSNDPLAAKYTSSLDEEKTDVERYQGSSSRNDTTGKATDFSEASPVDGYYDVFLSFRGDDTRKGFTTNLYHALQHNHIHTFMDDDLSGETFDHIVEVIAKSRMAVVIYSENYASSYWCQRELEMILKKLEDKKILVTPIFYKVDQKELNHIPGKITKYLDKYLAAYNVDPWKVAVRKLGGLTGISYTEIEYRSENKFIIHVIDVIKKTFLTSCHPPTQERSIKSKQFPSSSTEVTNYPNRGAVNFIYQPKQSSSLNDQVEKEESDHEDILISMMGSYPNMFTETVFSYDVFLSFRGDDTCESFPSTLSYSLSKVHKLKTFINVILQNEGIMVQKYKISVVIFSENFAESEACLKELVKMFEERDRRGKEVLPVFYEVNPSELRHLDKGKTKVHMDKHINTYGKDSNKIMSWSNAIKELGNLHGFTYWSSSGKKEVQLADEISQYILGRLYV